MRKIIVLTFITLDGIMQAPGGPGEDDNQIFEILKQFFEKQLVVLSHPERLRLFQQVTKAILADVLGKIGGTK